MASSVLLVLKRLAKPLLKKVIEFVGSNTSKNLQKIIKKGLTNEQILELLRLKKTGVGKKEVAKKFGINVKEINSLLKEIKNTKKRVEAVTGRNFLKNLNKVTGEKYKNIKEYKNKTKIKNVKDRGDEIKLTTLKILDKKMQQYDISLKNEEYLNIDDIPLTNIIRTLEYFDKDFYYKTQSGTSRAVYVDIDNKGYKRGLYEEDFYTLITDILYKGYSIRKD